MAGSTIVPVYRRRCRRRLFQPARRRLQQQQQRPVRLPGNGRCGLEHRLAVPPQPRRPLLRQHAAELQLQRQRRRPPCGRQRQLHQQQLQLDGEPAVQVRRTGGCSAAAAAAAAGDVVHGVLRLGSLEPQPAGAGDDRAGGPRPSSPRAAPASRPRVTPTRRARRLQHGAVAAPRQRGQGRPGAQRRTGHRDRRSIGRGEQGLLVPTPDGVREPQNRRVEIVLQ